MVMGSSVFGKGRPSEY